ncbi:putative RNA polymerase II subunit B1 CTD phosphatase RPAP2 isoform X1 [Montipora capricornis]|uniref:putative RNA polymerase II subunit B1 CTD phosphatase RPAP2 isoform X1 n=1 Tax=Montipora capricornis TaxID=246305 RepID=UPI0035F16D65
MADELLDGKTKPNKQPKHSRKKQTSARRGKTAVTNENADEQQRLKDLEVSIRSQVAAEERAHKIVEKLVLEDNISTDFLMHAGNLITTSHYADVVEERMIAKKCGYAICNNQLSKVPLQRYKISLRTNKVYDITERKCFCSSFCFKASKYFESQVFDSPVWTRIGESLRPFSLLENDDSSSSANSEGFCPSSAEHNTCKDFLDDSEENFPQNTAHEYRDLVYNPNLRTTHSESTIPERCRHDHKDIPTARVSSLALSSPTDKGQFPSKIEKVMHSEDMKVHSVKEVFQQWCTPLTLEFLGVSVQSKAQCSFPDNDSFAARVALFLQPATTAEDDSDSDSEKETNPRISDDNIVIKERKRLTENSVCILPPIDSKSQSIIRRRIVLEHLFRTFPDLLSELKLTVGEVSRDVTELVHTFSLCSTNVTLKPQQWKIVALAVIVILGRKNAKLLQAMESYSKEFDALLGRLAISRKDIDRVLSPLTSYELQNSKESEDFEGVNTRKSSAKTDKVAVKEREDYGDMEELD